MERYTLTGCQKVPDDDREQQLFSSYGNQVIQFIQGVFLHWASPKKLKYGKPRLGESYFLKMEVLEVQTPPIFLDFPPIFRLITRNPYSFHCVETVLPIVC